MTETFITGSSGVLGFELLDRLSRSMDTRVTGVSRRPLPLPGDNLRNIETARVLTSDWLSPTLTDATVIHCAGLSNPRLPFASLDDLYGQEILPHANMVEKMVGQGWRGHFIYLSSGGAIYGDSDVLPIPESQPLQPKSYYALTKANMESSLIFLARHHGFALTILRVANSYGTRVPKRGQGVIPILIDALRQDETFTVLGTGEALRDYLHIEDIAAAVQAACRRPPAEGVAVFNIGSGVGTSLLTLIEKVSRISGRNLKYATLPSPVDVASNVLDISRATRVLDWRPRITLDDGIATMMEEQTC